MHICLPDTREVKPAHGSAFLLYNVHIDGLYHCSLRFKQLLHLHQILTKKFNSSNYQMPTFPPKKLLPLSAAQVEERRALLEKYMQTISQDKTIANSSIFNLFLLEAQRESTRIRENQVHLDIELVNGQKIRLQILTTDSVDTVLTAVCRALGLEDRYHAYFCLCLCGYDVVRDKLIIKRRLSFFESPYVTLQMAIQQQEQLQSILPNNYNQRQASNTCCCQSCTKLATSSNLNKTDNNLHLQEPSTRVPLNGSSTSSSSSSSDNTTENNNNNNNDSKDYVKHKSQHLYHTHHDNSSSINGNQHHHTCKTINSPISSGNSFVTHRILLRKSYWDPIYDTYLLNDQQALNLLFIQTVYDIKHSLVFVNKETYHQLESLLASDSKMEYILLARTLKYYNYVHFEPCLSDYPRPRTKVMISIGSKELNMRVLKPLKSYPSSFISSPSAPSPSTSRIAYHHHHHQQQQHRTTSTNQQSEQILYCTSSIVPSGYHHLLTRDDLIEEEYNFKVLLIRSWRLSSLETLNSNAPAGSTQPTFTGAGRRLRGLSLFSRKLSIGSNSSSGSPGSSVGDNQQCDTDHRTTRTVIDSGTDGHSLLAALAGHRFNSGNNNSNCSNKRPSSYQCQCNDQPYFSQYELSFEYLVSKDTLKWITISSDQAIFISISLQNVVDELVSKREGKSSLDTADTLVSVPPPLPERTIDDSASLYEPGQFIYMDVNGSLRSLKSSGNQFPASNYALALAQRQRHKTRRMSFQSDIGTISSGGGCAGNRRCSAFEISSFRKAPSPIINDAFEGESNFEDL